MIWTESAGSREPSLLRICQKYSLLIQGLIKNLLDYAAVNKRNTTDLFNVSEIFDKVSLNLLSRFKVRFSLVGRR